MFLNITGAIGVILLRGTETVTGSIVATLFLILLFLMAVCMMFSIPLEFMAVILLPYCFAVGAHYSDFMIPIILIITYVSALMAHHWILK